MTDAEPLEGITDAIMAAESFLYYARAHRERPRNLGHRRDVLKLRDGLIAKLQALK